MQDGDFDDAVFQFTLRVDSAPSTGQASFAGSMEQDSRTAIICERMPLILQVSSHLIFRYLEA